MLNVSVMMALGAFRFGVSGSAYQQFIRRAEYRWTQVDRIGREPAMQFAGPGAQSVTLGGVIYPHYRGGLRQVDQMRLQAGLGRPMMMVDGLGWVWKKWVITGVEEEKSYFMADGAPRRIDFTLELQSYGPDGGGLGAFLGALF